MCRIVCLANSKKHGERCIAGIDISTGWWIRPVTHRVDGAVTWDVRQVNGQEPQLLDVLHVPLVGKGPDNGFQPENRLIKTKPWEKIARFKADEILRFCEDDSVILLNHSEYIPYKHFSRIPQHFWKSLQLVHTKKTLFYKDTLRKPTWRTSFRYRNGTMCLDLMLTDVSLLKRLEEGKSVQRDCILTISLGVPWTPNKTTEKRCYKLVAGVVEL